MGWLVFPFGIVPSDFWVAEAYPFLSAYTNPHFTLSLAILVWLMTFRPERRGHPRQRRLVSWGWGAVTILAAAVLGSSSSFALVLALAIMSALLVVRVLGSWRSGNHSSAGLSGLVSDLREDWSFRQVLMRLICSTLGGAPVVLYTVWVLRTDPVLAAWNAQNQTPTPPFWDMLLAFSPALILALAGLWRVVRRNEIQIQAVCSVGGAGTGGH